MISILLNSFLENSGLWAHAHMDLHLQAANKIQQIREQPAFLFPLEPIPENLDIWLNSHQQMHDNISFQLNLTSYDFSILDVKNKQFFDSWLEQHFQAHQDIEQFLLRNQ